MLAKVRRNPRHDSVRRALDAVAFALSAHEVWVSEFSHGDGARGVEYVLGFGKSAEVVGTFDVPPHGEVGSVQWVGRNGLSGAQVGLIEAHADLFAAMM